MTGETVKAQHAEPSYEPKFYACLHAREFPLQALLRLRHALRGTSVAVLEGHPPLERVCAANPAARRDGVADGMTRVEAESFAGMTLLRRSLREETEARAAVLACAAKYTPSIEDVSTGTATICVLDLGGTEKLFGPPLALCERLAREIGGFGMRVSVALSVNFYAAVALACAGQGVRLIAPGDEPQALAPLLLSVLPLSSEQLETLELWGIRTLGGLAALPEKALVARMGQVGKRLRSLARGEQEHLFQPALPSFTLRESYEFNGPVAVMDSLLFVLAPMLDQLLLRAGERALSLASLTVLLRLDRGRAAHGQREPQGKNESRGKDKPAAGSQQHDGSHAQDASPEHQLRQHQFLVRPALPTTDRRLLLKLLQLELDAHPPGAAVLSLEVTGEPGVSSKVQLGLFSPQGPESSRLDVTLARLRGLVGDACVGSPRLLDTHAPDSFVVQGFTLPVRVAAGGEPPQGAPAVRRLRPPEPLTMRMVGVVPDGFRLGACQYQVVEAIGPWRESGSWWSTAAWSYEQWDLVAAADTTRPAALKNEEKLCCRVMHDLLHEQWMLEAIYD